MPSELGQPGLLSHEIQEWRPVEQGTTVRKAKQMSLRAESVLFLGKKNDALVDLALGFCRDNFASVEAHLGDWGDPLPPAVARWRGDYALSYLSRWIVPVDALQRTAVAAINFHPASTEYPGIGCNNFALYEGAAEFGVTCHHMAPQVDTGSIIAERRFPVFHTDTVASLLSRTYVYQLALFYEIIGLIIQGEPLPSTSKYWSRAPLTRAALNELAHITSDMPPEEVIRRTRATTFGVWKPTLQDDAKDPQNA